MISARAGCILLTTAVALPTPGTAQSDCRSRDYRVVQRHWDAVLRLGLESRQNCSHPEWPAQSVLVRRGATEPTALHSGPLSVPIPIKLPFLVHAGEAVRLWRHDEKARIEIYGIVEQSARNDERVMVRVVRLHGDEGTSVERITGIVRAAGDVEMER